MHLLKITQNNLTCNISTVVVTTTELNHTCHFLPMFAILENLNIVQKAPNTGTKQQHLLARFHKSHGTTVFPLTIISS